MPQIRLERVSNTRRIKQMAAVQEINLTVEQGEFLFLTGSSGGKKYCSSSSGDLALPPGPLSGYQPDAAFQASPRPPAPGFRPRTQLSQLMRKRTISENLSAVAMLTQSRKLRLYKPGFRRLWLWSACLMWGARYPVELSYGSAAAEFGLRDYQQPVHFWFWMS